MVDPAFFQHCAFICVDIQEGEAPQPLSEDQLPADWKAMGFQADDVAAANRFAWEVCLPNAVRVVEACRATQMPMIFLHWGFRLPGGMDLDPLIRQVMARNHGGDASQWPGHIAGKGAQPAAVLGVQPGDYIIAKTGQDAFQSSSLGFVLVNLGVRHLIFVGGHTEACLGKTATSAKRKGYRTLCVEDATSNARESSRQKGIQDSQFDYVVTTSELMTILTGYRDSAHITSQQPHNP